MLDHVTYAYPPAIAPDAQRRVFAHPPVFLHCGWRTRGTWVWNRFRSMRGVAGYYEPLGEMLAEVRPSTLALISAESWPSGHRDLDRPYFEEFRLLLKRNRPGVQEYQTRFATDDFFASPEAALPELEQYLRLLIRTAEERGEQPVLKFCRSIGRIGWMQRHFPDAAHIVVLRNPLAQFGSALRQFTRHGNAYFLAMPLLLLAMHGNLPAVGACVRHIGPELPSLVDCNTLRARLSACEASLRCSDPGGWYRSLLAFWVLTAAAIPDDIDLIIDSDRLNGDSHYRQQCEIDVETLTGRTVHFDDPARNDDPEALEGSGIRCSEVLKVHRSAEAFLAEERGTCWADTPTPGHVGLMLAEASLQALDAEAARRAPRIKGMVPQDPDPDFEAMLLSALGRAARAERELAALYASRSWRVTAPLRWLRERLRPEN